MLFGTSLPYILLMALLGLVLGMWKGRAAVGALLGLVLGPVGLLILAFVPPARRVSPGAGSAGDSPFSGQGAGPFGHGGFGTPVSCPKCKNPVSRGDKVCPHCGNLLINVHYRVEE